MSIRLPGLDRSWSVSNTRFGLIGACGAQRMPQLGWLLVQLGAA